MFDFDAKRSTTVESKGAAPLSRVESTNGPLSPALLDKMNHYSQAANYPTVDQIYQCEKSMIEPQTTLDVALPPDAIDAVVFESYEEQASRTET